MKRKALLRCVLFFAAILLTLASVVLVFVGRSKTPVFSIAIQLLQMTNVPLEEPLEEPSATFLITNHSDLPIRPIGCSLKSGTISTFWGPTLLLPGEAKTMQVGMPYDANLPCTLTFVFQGPVSRLYLIRKRLDSTLQTIHVEVPGLRPKPYQVAVETTIPKKN
jgi:hypothetical protein